MKSGVLTITKHGIVLYNPIRLGLSFEVVAHDPETGISYGNNIPNHVDWVEAFDDLVAHLLWKRGQ